MWELLAIILMLLAVFLIPASSNLAFVGLISKVSFVIGLGLVIWCLIKIIREVYFYYKTRDKDSEF